MKTNFEKTKTYALCNLERAGKMTHISQRKYLREAYKKVKQSKTYEDLLGAIDESHEKAPYENAINKGFPNQRYSLREIFRMTEMYAVSLENPEYDKWYYRLHYTGYPTGGGYDGYENDERDREKSEYYFV
jgi:hypothetical protein